MATTDEKTTIAINKSKGPFGNTFVFHKYDVEKKPNYMKIGLRIAYSVDLIVKSQLCMGDHIHFTSLDGARIRQG